MQLLIPPGIASQLIDALRQAGRRETGGILMGEHVGVDTFRVRALTVQRKKGTFAAFVRIVSEILAPLRVFFDATKHDYRRFNYLGEWHSHHSFELKPSTQDHATMCDMAMDPHLGAHFIVLLLVRLDGEDKLEGSVILYEPDKAPCPGTIVQEVPL